MSLTLHLQPWSENFPIKTILDLDQCWVLEGEDVGVVNHDLTAADRGGTNLWETNEIHPKRPVIVDPVGLRERIMSLLGWRVYPTGKIYTRVDLRPQWWWWTVDNVGPKNAEKITDAGDGTQDVNNDGVPLFTPDHKDIYYPNPDKQLKQMACFWGGDMFIKDDEIVQAGKTYHVVRVPDYNDPPVKIAREWYYYGEPRHWWKDLWMFSMRCNRRLNGPITWLTPGGINVVNDAGATGGKGFENVVMSAPQKAAIEAVKTTMFPKPPFEVWMNSKSYIMNGERTFPRGGREVKVDAIAFYMSNTFFHETGTPDWYAADIMNYSNVTEPYPGSILNYECYATFDGTTPWMGRAGARKPICPWTRQWYWPNGDFYGKYQTMT